MSGRGDGDRLGRAVRGSEAATTLTLTEAAARAGVSRSTVSGWVAAGRLPVTRAGGRRRVRSADLAAARAAAHAGAVVPAWRRDRRRAGVRLRALREAAGLSQLELAAAAGLTHEEISRLELGRLAPVGTSVRRLAQALGTEPAAFVGRGELAGAGLTTAEAAARLGVPAGRVVRWLKTGELEGGTKVSGQWRVPEAAVYELLGSGRMRGRSGRLDPRFRG
jgi:excisionase family DNA binding protein